MRTIAKALRILDVFSDRRPQLGLSEIAGLTSLDRATCYRMLKVLNQYGYVGKSAITKKYTLGATVLRLARARELIWPVNATLRGALADLTEVTTETSHASLIAGYQLATVAVYDGIRSNRVHVEPGGLMQPHATASGLVCLAYGGADFIMHALNSERQAFTDQTIVDRTALDQAIIDVQKRGYGIADRSFDTDVVGIAAPIFGPDELAIGAIAVATPAVRMDAITCVETAASVVVTALATTIGLGGTTPKSYSSAVSGLLQTRAGQRHARLPDSAPA